MKYSTEEWTWYFLRESLRERELLKLIGPDHPIRLDPAQATLICEACQAAANKNRHADVAANIFQMMQSCEDIPLRRFNLERMVERCLFMANCHEDRDFEAEAQAAITDALSNNRFLDNMGELSKFEQAVQAAPWTDTQQRILEELNGFAMTKEKLAEKIGLADRTIADAVKVLIESGKIKNKRGLGYYRTDAPPAL